MPLRTPNIFFRAILSQLLFYFVMSFSKFFNEIPSHFSVLLEISLVVQFSKIKSAVLCRSVCLSFTAYLLYNNLLKLSTPFLKVFCTFFSFVLLSIFYSPFLAFLCILTTAMPPQLALLPLGCGYSGIFRFYSSFYLYYRGGQLKCSKMRLGQFLFLVHQYERKLNRKVLTCAFVFIFKGAVSNANFRAFEAALFLCIEAKIQKIKKKASK